MLARPDTGTFEIRRGVVSQALVDDILRLLHLDVLERGASAEELGRWLWAMHWFPHLSHDAKVVAVADALPADWRVGKLCDPQILLQFPHVGPEPEITFHRDEEPPWADGGRYLRIVGVALSPWRAENGGLLVLSGDDVVPVELDPGDAVAMAPDLLHSGGVNLTGAIRYGVYFRWLDEQRDAEP
jgi:ectoine hydroxylase-related dioxygenase (phytanoyl-CoA dioxygenase family)